MLQGEHSAILSTFIKLLFVINIFVLCILEWQLKTGCSRIKEYEYNMFQEWPRLVDLEFK